MRTGSTPTPLLLGLLLALPATAQNVYDVPPGGGSFTDPANWNAGGGPSTWAGGTAVDGSIDFDATGGSGDITVSGIDLVYTGLTGLVTSNSVDPVQLILEGDGALVFDNDGGTIVIAPEVGLTLRVATVFNGNVELRTDGQDTVGGVERLLVDSTMRITGDRLLITGANGVDFSGDSVLTMDGLITIGETASGSALRFERATTLDGDIALLILAGSSVELGGSIDEAQDFVLGGLAGGGSIFTQRGPGANDASNLVIAGNAPGERPVFSGSMTIQGSLTVTGDGTVFRYEPDSSVTPAGAAIEGSINVEDGGRFLVGPNEVFGISIPTMNVDSLNVSGGGWFGGNAWIQFTSSTQFSNLLNITDGWLVGGDENGQGQLRLTGQTFNSTLGPGSGLRFVVDSDQLNTSLGYFNFDTLSFLNLFGTRMYVDLRGDTFLSTLEQINVIQSSALLPDGELWQGINTTQPGAGSFGSLETSRVTRFIEIVDNFDDGFFGFATSSLQITIGADYATPAGSLAALGNTLNGLIASANADPTGWQANLLAQLDGMAGTTASYQQALGSLMPTTQFAAERAAAETMFFDVQTRNLREIAIGSRGPGMVRTAQSPQLIASVQEESAIDSATAGSRRPDIIINPSTGAVSTSSSDSDVFHALFVDGYGSWNDMSGVGFTPGYTNDTWGVAAGWGIGLAEGVTVGITAGWEQNSITLDGNVGDATMDSIRGAPFISWSGVDGNTEQYAILSVGGAYNYGSGTRVNTFGDDRSLEVHGWEIDMMGAVGTRVPLGTTSALQPEASLRYTLLSNSGSETQSGSSYDYSGGTFQYVNSRLGVGYEWFANPAFRTTARVGYQAQYYNWGSSSWTLPGGVVSATESPGSGTVNQAYVGLQLDWVPSWNTTLSVSFDGAYGQSTQNSISGGLLIRF